MTEKILCRAIIEILGKPQEYVEKSMRDYIKKIKEDDKYVVRREESAEIKKQESELWATFTELEMEVENIQDLISFCFDYMPSIIEILEPERITLTDKDISIFFNDLQARLHSVDMVAKQVKLENDGLGVNMAKLMKNYLTVLLGKGNLTLEQLSRFTGVKEETLGDYMDKLLDEGLVTLEKGVYSLNEEKLGKKQLAD